MLVSMQSHQKNAVIGTFALPKARRVAARAMPCCAKGRKIGDPALRLRKTRLNSRHQKVSSSAPQCFPQFFPQLWKSWGIHRRAGKTTALGGKSNPGL